MDPLSITVSVSSLLGACAVVTQRLNDIKGKYARSDTTFGAMSAECIIISSTLAQVGQVVKSDPQAFSNRLTLHGARLDTAFADAIGCCDVTLVALGDLLRRCNQQTSRGILSWKGKAKLLFNEQELRERLQTLRSLNQALTALLSAIQVETVSAMSQILSRNVTALKSVKDDSAALQKTYAPSIVSSSVGTVFDFDNEVINSSAYRRAFHSFSAAQADRSIDVSDHSSEDDDVALPDPNIREEQPSSRNNAEPKEERRESPVNASTAVTLLPIKFTEKLQLTSLGIMPSYIKFNNCTLESDHFISVRQQSHDNAQLEVVIINLKNGNSVVRWPIKAASVIMHWNKEIVALKAGDGKTLQIFDLALKAKIRSTKSEESVVFWKWFSETSLGLVTNSSVYHWNVFNPVQTLPQKVFDRSQILSGCEIINYRVSEDEKWSVLVGISQHQTRVVGSMQLYSIDHGSSQAIEGHAAAFATLSVEGAPSYTNTKLFTFANRSATGAKLHIMEVGQQAPNFHTKVVDIHFPAEATGDFPVALQVSNTYKVIYLVTKYGFFHIYDLQTGAVIFMNRISNTTIFTTTCDEESMGIIGINRDGQVLSITIDERTIIPYLLQNPKNADLANKMSSRVGFVGAIES